ncbi:unnamed protein product [Coregonus sp. 'balchen']|nr:unnamed protein product [Coregonus sp. 'balchen']
MAPNQTYTTAMSTSSNVIVDGGLSTTSQKLTTLYRTSQQPQQHCLGARTHPQTLINAKSAATTVPGIVPSHCTNHPSSHDH